MAVLRQVNRGIHVPLNVRHIVGRLKATSHTCIPENDISRIHAIISWKDGSWRLQDQSRNGTLVNGKLVTQGQVKLEPGDKINFGRGPEARWEFIDDSPPTSFLRAMGEDEGVLALAKCPGIPNPECMTVSFFFEDLQWKEERDGKVKELTHDDIIDLEGKLWQFVHNEDMETTQNVTSIADTATFCFELSPDEEHIGIRILMNDLVMDLGERVYHYMLLALARKRIDDRESGYSAPDQGWMDLEDLVHDMSRELRKEIDEYYLNVQIYRLRKQLNRTEPFGYLFSNVVQRRRGAIRFVASQFKIFKDNQCISELPFLKSA